jgi:hypothetical protein
MNNPWKLATLGLALTGVTAVSTGVTTAYLMRPTASAETVPGAGATAPSAGMATLAYAPTVPAAPARAVTVAPPPVARPVAARVVRTSTVQPVADDCATGGQRAMKIAKPGVIGALAGAGLGAVGGAIADGGKAAGKGAIIGGLAGAALGGGYGAYKTQQECGTILGSPAGAFTSAAPATTPAVTTQALRSVPGASNGIQVFNAR